MPDFLSKETRSRVMSRIRSKDTKPELALRRSLWAIGVRGWRCHPRTVPGKPDVAFTRWRVAIFVDGCFWHGHPDYFTPGKSGAYWDAKIARTKERDREANEALSKAGWRVLRLWDFEVEEDLDGCLERVTAALAEARAASGAAIEPAGLAGSKERSSGSGRPPGRLRDPALGKGEKRLGGTAGASERRPVQTSRAGLTARKLDPRRSRAPTSRRSDQ